MAKYMTHKVFLDPSGEISSRSRMRNNCELWLQKVRIDGKLRPVTVTEIRSRNLDLLRLNYANHWQTTCF
jgi:hypothetical protein